MSWLWIWMRHTARPEDGLMVGSQSFEYRDSGETIATLPVRYRPTGRAEFEQLASRTGFEVEALYGDYERSPFDEEHSEQMIWCLRRRIEP